MAYRVPFLKVIGPDGTDQIPVWGSRLVGVRIVPRYVDTSDECTFMFTDKPPYATAPAENTPFTVSIGWSAETAALGGTYYLKRIHLLGEPKRGEQIHYICRPLEQSGLNEVASQHFGADNGNTTLGDVFTNLFTAAGIGVEVAASIASMPIPGGHVVQWQQSHIDFATDLANDAGGVVKPMDGKVWVLDRNAGQSVSGNALASFIIPKTDCYQYDVELDPRFQYQSMSVSYSTAAPDGSSRSKAPPKDRRELRMRCRTPRPTRPRRRPKPRSAQMNSAASPAPAFSSFPASRSPSPARNRNAPAFPTRSTAHRGSPPR
ncbi:MAG TPA: hypothetical protein VH414_01375 [Lichenihabitans sp.]|nr:hypothetical protein [Lichenihabitans sp.]